MTTVTTKICTKCKKEKDFSLFSKDKRQKTGLCTQCKPCKADSDKESRLNPKRKKMFLSDTEKQCSKCLSIKNKSEFNKCACKKSGLTSHCKSCLSEEWKKNNERHAIRSKGYREKNKEILAEKARIRESNRIKTDYIYALKKRIKSRILLSISGSGYTKKSRTHEILGCDFETLAKHLESQFVDGMTWENRNEWHVDHVIPLASATTESEVIKLNHYLNLQPLWALENRQKSDKMPKQSIVNSIQLKIAKEKKLPLQQLSLL